MKFNRIKLLILILIVTIIFLLNGCASTPKSPFKRVETIPEGYALVYVYVTKLSFLIPPLQVQIGDNLVGLSSSYTFYPLYTKPARELKYKLAFFNVQAGKERVIKIELKPNKTYYLRCSYKIKRPVWISKCTVVPPEIGEKEIVKCKLGQLYSGKEYDVPYELMHEEELTHEEEQRAREKAVLYTYKPLRGGETPWGETPSISILTPGGNQDVVGLRGCQCYKLYTRPGEIQYTTILNLDPNSYNYKFDVEAGRRYYIKDSVFPKVIEPEIGKKEINNCIKLFTQLPSGHQTMDYEGFDYSIYAQAISKLDREEIKKVLTKKDKIGLVWLCENNTAKIYKTRSGGVAVGAGSAAGVVASNPGAAGSTMSGSISGGLIAGGVAATIGLFSEIATGVGNIKLDNRLKEEKVASLVKDYYLDAYRNPLTSEGFKVKIVKNAYDKEQLKKINEFGLAPYDFRTIAQELQVDNLIVLDIRGFGVVKKYKTFSLADKPKGYSFVEGYLVEGASNRIISKIPFETQINVEGEWDTPPDFSNLVIAVKTSLERACSELYDFLFNKTPSDKNSLVESEIRENSDK